MATPDIGTTISEGYSRGLDRLGPWFPSLAVLGVATALVTAVIAQLQVSLVPDAGDMLSAAFRGDTDGFTKGDLRTIQLLSVVSSAVGLVLSAGASVVFAGQLHRERHGDTSALPGPGGVLPAVIAGFMALMPRIGVLFGVLLLGQFLSAFSNALGGLLSLIGGVMLIYLGVRWFYAAVIVGAREATGDGAFDRSAAEVDGNWWRTFGVLIVVGLATALPVFIAASLVGAILPGTFLSAFGRSFVGTVGATILWAAALESAWFQVEGASGVDPLDPTRGELSTPRAPAPPPPGPAPGEVDPRGPFV